MAGDRPENSYYEIYDHSKLVCIWDNNGCRTAAEEFALVHKELLSCIKDLKTRDEFQSIDFNDSKGKELIKDTSKQPAESDNYNNKPSDSVYRLQFSDLTDYELAFMISHASAEQLRRIQRKKMGTNLKSLESHLPDELKHYSSQNRSGSGMLQLPDSGDKPKFKHAIPMPDDEAASKPKYDLPIPMDSGEEGDT